MFNEDQSAHMLALAEVPPELRHWCGWYTLKETASYRDGHCHPECPREFTTRDKLNIRCECCESEPNLNTGIHTHRVWCTPEVRRAFHAAHDLGGES